MIFGRKRRTEVVGTEATQDLGDPDLSSVDGAGQDQESAAAVLDGEREADQVDDSEEEVDWRENGPFDYEEVDLGADEIPRIDLGTLIVTPWDGLGLQLQVDEQTKKVLALTGVWQESGLEVVLFAAAGSGGLADELREEAVEEAAEAGGTAELADGPFGPEVRRVLPQEGPAGEQLFHVSRVWFAQGPRWLLRGTLLGEVALDSDDQTKAAPFLEMFRNLVVRRGVQPMVPGERMTMELPEGAA